MDRSVKISIYLCYSTAMKVPVSGGAAEPVGPPGFGRLNDIHVHKDGSGPLGKMLS